ncbi:hypothetical protein Pmani_025010 [Petrolisthes manimaculis]|uniref:Uncharacterized protein n=1 Tax=Petrolisthes manimaculis TaxID=1843537 RepID=A0AAE1P8T8_9EUCA|nr:hypothetical protein Pmani_025010 [Petrolisthes manimaculis]
MRGRESSERRGEANEVLERSYEVAGERIVNSEEGKEEERRSEVNSEEGKEEERRSEVNSEEGKEEERRSEVNSEEGKEEERRSEVNSEEGKEEERRSEVNSEEVLRWLWGSDNGDGRTLRAEDSPIRVMRTVVVVAHQQGTEGPAYKVDIDYADGGRLGTN